MIVNLLTEHHLEFLSFKRRLHRLVRVYTCQNGTLLEISCTGSYVSDGAVVLYRLTLVSPVFSRLIYNRGVVSLTLQNK